MIKRIQRRIHHFKALKKMETFRAEFKCSPQNTIALFSNPRGGSTWLGELLNTLPNSSLLTEPLFRGIYKTDGQMPSANKDKIPTDVLNFWYYQPIAKNQNWQEAEQFFENLFNLKLLPMSLLENTPVEALSGSQLFIHKFCYGNLLMPWVLERFQLASIFLLRHPGAVVASQLRHGGWKHIDPTQHYPFQIPDSLKELSPFKEHLDLIEEVKYPFENFCLMWALSVKEGITHFKSPPGNAVQLHYEDLVSDTQSVLRIAFSKMGLQVADLWFNGLEKSKAQSSLSASKDFKMNGQLQKWMDRFTNEEKARMQDILDAVGIDVYRMNEAMPIRH